MALREEEQSRIDEVIKRIRDRATQNQDERMQGLRFDLGAFVNESNDIEGIYGYKDSDLVAHHDFLNLPEITIPDIVDFVSTIQPDAVLRDTVGLDVRIGDYYPPKGGPDIRTKLAILMQGINSDQYKRISPHTIHCLYETLHPFTDGNGRSGRAIWLWMMCQRGRAPDLGFLHEFYYQTLSQKRDAAMDVFGDRVT